MEATRLVFAVTTDAGGAATILSDKDVNGEIVQIRYVPDPGANPLPTGADIVFSGEVTGKVIMSQLDIGTVAKEWAPRQPTHAAVDGSALLYAAGGVGVGDRIVISDEKIKLVVAQGGNTKLGTFYCWYIGY